MSINVNCITIEDEPLALERVRGFVSKLKFLNLLAFFDNAIEALSFLKANKVDLIFLDINMDGFSGIQFLETSIITSHVVITTAYHEYALKGFDLKVTDYLLKPFTFERFVQAVDRVQSSYLKSEASGDMKFIFVKTEYRLEKVLLSEVLYIEGMRDYRRIHTTGKPIVTLQTFNDFEKEIPPSIICRVHKSFMVALSNIESIERDRIKIKTAVIPISDTYKQAFYNLIGSAAK